MRVKVYIGANYGDEGKGRVASSDCALARSMSNKLFRMRFTLIDNTGTPFGDKAWTCDADCIGVLTNGGPQRGHREAVFQPACSAADAYLNLEPHIYRHWSVCSAYKAFTYMCRDFLIYPVLLDLERIDLRERFTKLWGTPAYALGCGCDPLCKVITMYDIWLNQITELNRGSQKHGSVGMGIWETLLRYQTGPNKCVAELLNASKGELRMYLRDVRTYFWDAMKSRSLEVPKDYEDLLTEKALDTQDTLFIKAVESMNRYTMLLSAGELMRLARHAGIEDIYCENGQGLLLDQSLGDMHQTPSTTGATAANDILEHVVPGDIVNLKYVTRSYLTRHGAGHMETSEGFAWDISDYINTKVESNKSDHPFQGTFRYAKLDVEKLAKRVSEDALKTLAQNPKLNTDRTAPSIFIEVTHVDEYTMDKQKMLHCFAQSNIYPCVNTYNCP